MPVPTSLNPSRELIDELRINFRQKMDSAKDTLPAGGFDERDLQKVFMNDAWLAKFLEHNDLDANEALKQLWDTCVWRKTEKINDINETNIRMEYVLQGIMFPRGKDTDGKTLFIYRSSLYTRGSRNLDDMKRMFLYWIERIIRESNNDFVTIVFDLTNAGLSNVDMDYTRYIINTFKHYYPFSLNYILVYDLPWILNATFQIIKRLLPAKAVSRLKNVNRQTIREYIDEDNMPVSWGGKDEYVFQFIPERRTKPIQFVNNNFVPYNNNYPRKVHFANGNKQHVSMIESNNTNQESSGGEMLRITPQNIIPFTRNGNELMGFIEIVNVDSKTVTYKIKTTAPQKFRVRPSTGVLCPGGSVTINIVLMQSQPMSGSAREKFLVMCMALGAGMSTNSQDLAELWKNTSASSLAVEQHRLKCSLPNNLDDSNFRNGGASFGDAMGGDGGYGGGMGFLGGPDDKLHPSSQLQQVVSQLNDTTHRLESQLKFSQTLQWISILLFICLSIAMVYILKAEIKASTSQYCLKHH